MSARTSSVARGWARAKRGATALRAMLHAIVGAPSYERYYAHARRCHPDVAPMGKDEFYLGQMERRYSRPGTRCC